MACRRCSMAAWPSGGALCGRPAGGAAVRRHEELRPRPGRAAGTFCSTWRRSSVRLAPKALVSVWTVSLAERRAARRIARDPDLKENEHKNGGGQDLPFAHPVIDLGNRRRQHVENEEFAPRSQFIRPIAHAQSPPSTSNHIPVAKSHAGPSFTIARAKRPRERPPTSKRFATPISGIFAQNVRFSHSNYSTASMMNEN